MKKKPLEEMNRFELLAEVKRLEWELYGARCRQAASWLFWSLNRPWTLPPGKKWLWTLYNLYHRTKHYLRSKP